MHNSEIPIEQINLTYVRQLEAAGLKDLNTLVEMDHLPLLSPTFLQIAIYNCDEELLTYLLDRKVDPELSFKNGTSLHLAVHRCESNLNIAKKLISLGVPLNVRECMMHWTALHLACYQGKYELARLLIDSGADMNITNVYNVNNPKLNLGKSPLHVAVEANQLAIVDLLCRKRANINAVSLEHGTPLISAIWLGNVDIVKLLVQRGADVNMVFKFCKVMPDMVNYLPVKVCSLTALHVAIVKSNQRMVKILLLNPTTNLNTVVEQYLTPLHYAVKFDVGTLKELLAAGANINALTLEKKTIVEYCGAEWAGDPEKKDRISGLLVEHATKLHVAGLHIIPEIAVDSDSTLAEQCRQELEQMRTTLIFNRAITIDKLFGCVHQLALTLEIDEFKSLLGKEVREPFQIYADIIQWRAVKVFYRRRLLVGPRFSEIWRFLNKVLFQELLSQEFIAGILPYLSYNDLYGMLKL